MSGLLAHSPAEIVRRLLVDLELGTDPQFVNNSYSGTAWPVFFTSEPDKGAPDSLITVYKTAGRLSGRTQPDMEMQEHNGIQVRVRASAPGVGFAKANAIAVALDRVHRSEATIGAAEYLIHAFTRTSDVLELGRDPQASGRRLYTINAVVSLEQTNL